MAIIRILKKERNFVLLEKTCLQDKALSWKAKGLHTYLMSLPDDWQLSIPELVRHSADGRDATYAGIKELTHAGYMTQLQVRCGNGRFGKGDYIVHEVPQPAFPDAGSTTVDEELVADEIAIDWKDDDSSTVRDLLGFNHLDSNLNSNGDHPAMIQRVQQGELCVLMQGHNADEQTCDIKCIQESTKCNDSSPLYHLNTLSPLTPYSHPPKPNTDFPHTENPPVLSINITNNLKSTAAARDIAKEEQSSGEQPIFAAAVDFEFTENDLKIGCKLTQWQLGEIQKYIEQQRACNCLAWDVQVMEAAMVADLLNPNCFSQAGTDFVKKLNTLKKSIREKKWVPTAKLCANIGDRSNPTGTTTISLQEKEQRELMQEIQHWRSLQAIAAQNGKVGLQAQMGRFLEEGKRKLANLREKFSDQLLRQEPTDAMSISAG